MIPFDESCVPPDLVTETYLTAMEAWNELRLEEAIELFEREPEGSVCYGLALGNKGQALLSLDRCLEAEDCLRQALAAGRAEACPHLPSQVQFRRNLAEAIGRQGRWAESFTLFEAASKHADDLLERCLQEREALWLQKAHVFNAWGNSYLYLSRWQDAADRYEAARAIHRELPARVREGYAETLTNLALALMKQMKLTTAELAAEEALDVARASGDEDQVYRIKIVAIQMGSSLVPAEDRESTLVAAAERATKLGQPSTAYLRFCIGADKAEEVGAWEEGRRFIQRARDIEGSIEGFDPHIAMLRGTEALLLRQAGLADEEIVPVLIDGARRWYQRLAQPIIPADFAAVAQSMHNHFRMLARHLLNLGRTDEALAAFEAGRSLLHYRQMYQAFSINLIRDNPFVQSDVGVSVDILRQARRTLRDGECAIILGVLPPQLVAFVVWNDRMEVVTQPWPHTLDEGNSLIQDTEMIPHRLAEGVGERAIPPLYRECARLMAGVVGASSIRGLTPYSILHSVPWRALLRNADVPWTQMPFSTGFGFLLRVALPAGLPLSGSPAVALGHGRAGRVELVEEARQFAAAFGDRGEIRATCRVSEVLSALQEDKIVLLSCHGKAVDTEEGPSTTFDLAGDTGGTVGVQIRDMVPASVTSPLVILSACESGVYDVQWGEFPIGAAPLLIQKGAQRCIGSRFVLGAAFARRFFPSLGQLLAVEQGIEEAFAASLTHWEAQEVDLWRDLACLELLGGA